MTFDPRLVSELDHWLRQRNQAEQQMRRLVKELRLPPSAGQKPAPWSVIGEALHMTKQAAQQKYSKHVYTCVHCKDDGCSACS